MAEINITDEAIDAALCEIKNKHRLSDTTNDNGPKNSLQQLVKKLYEEFDCLGIPKSKENVPNAPDVMQLVVDVFKLINVHRKSVARLKDSNIDVARLKTDNARLEKKIATSKNEMSKKDDNVEAINRKLVLLRLECDDLKKDKHRLQQELDCVKKAAATKEKELEHKINQLHHENLNFKNTIEKNTGNFRSKDDIVAETICKYKMNEEVYTDTIRKLQDNNQGLIVEILKLKEEVLLALYEKNKQDEL